jgi:signal transduction histidine kinase
MHIDPILFVNILSTGIILCSAITIFILGSKVVSTRFYAIFWFVIFLFSFSYVTITECSTVFQFYIPVFYLIYLFVVQDEKFRPQYLLLLLIPAPLIFIVFYFSFYNALLFVFYHLMSWIILLLLTFRKNNPKKQKEQKPKKNIIMIMLTLISVFPFILINFFISIVLMKELIFLDILPPCLAVSSVLLLYFTVKDHILTIDSDYYMNLDFIKKSLATEKKTIIEKLSASLIHEIKNPISAIQSLNQQLMKRFESMETPQIRKYLEIIEGELDRMKELSETYLKNIRANEHGTAQDVDLGELLESIGKLLVFEFNKKQVLFEADASVRGLTVRFNIAYLRQILINLIYNSIEAGSKKIKIYGSSNGSTAVFIEDDGNGIKENETKHLFEPFFSTKPDGTGLGLSICKEILNENFGDIEVAESSAGRTVFKITFSNLNK